MQDLHSNIKEARVISPISPAATGTITGQVVDTQGYDSVEFVIAAGAQTTTGITVTPVVKSGSATGSLASASASELSGTEAAAALSGTAGSNNQARVGYVGADRYVSCDLAVAGAATGVYSVVAILGNPRVGPQSQ